MKVHVFYLKSNDSNLPDTLYAFTNQKDIANEFMKQRDMNKFIHKKIEMDEYEYKSKLDQYRRFRLGYSKLYTKVHGVFSDTLDIVKVVCTWGEEESTITHSDKLWVEYCKYLFDAKCLKNEYLRALEKLLFFRFYTFYKKGIIYDRFYEPYYTSYGPVDDFIYDMQDTLKFKYDDLKLFLKFYGNTFK